MSRVIAFRSTQVLLPDGVKPATILVEDGYIKEIVDYDCTLSNGNLSPMEVTDCGSHLVMTGLVDSHVHINEPGRTDWEGFETASKAAAAGGVTTLVDMPLNSLPPTTTVANLNEKKMAAENQCYVDVGFWGGLIPGNKDDLLPLLEAGVPGFKCFLIHSGVEEFPHVTESDLREAMAEVQGTNAVILFHAEVDCACAGPNATAAPRNFQTFLESRPAQMEIEAIALVCKLCLEFKVKCHIVHLSSAAALPLIREAKAAGAPLTVETCYHYLVLEAEAVPDGATQFKCCPPIREHENRELLWQGVKDGTIDMIVSDHSPCTPELKRPDTGDFMQAWGGIASLQLGLPLLWTEGQQRGLTFQDLERLLSTQPAQLAQLTTKGRGIRPGQQADLTIWNPDQEFTVRQEDLFYKNKISPYLGRTLRGTVELTVLRGQIVFSRKSSSITGPYGQLLQSQKHLNGDINNGKCE